MANNYSRSKCPKCDSTAFEAVEDAPLNSQYKYTFIRCVTCKTLISVMDFISLGDAVVKMKDDLNKLKRHLNIQ